MSLYMRLFECELAVVLCIVLVQVKKTAAQLSDEFAGRFCHFKGILAQVLSMERCCTHDLWKLYLKIRTEFRCSN